MVSPGGAQKPPVILGEKGVKPDAKDGAPGIVPVTKSAQVSDIPTVAPSPQIPPEPERLPEVEAPAKAPREPPVEIPAAGLPAEAPVPSEPSVVTPPEPSPAPAPAPDVTAAAVPGEQAALPEPDFHYADAKVLIDEQARYLRSVCLAKAEKPATRLKLRIDVRTNGRPKLRIFSGSKSVRECVRGVLMFPFKPSPRGGAFDYTLTETGSTLVRVPLDPAVSQ